MLEFRDARQHWPSSHSRFKPGKEPHMRPPHLIRGVAIALIAGCVSTNAAVLDPTVKYQKICPDGVEIFTSAQRVAGDYREVALLHSKGESGWTDERQMAASQRKKAAELGANGIVMGDIKEPNAGTKIIGSILGTGSERKGAALAIYIPSDSARVQRACGTGPRYQMAANTNGRPADPSPAAHTATQVTNAGMTTSVPPTNSEEASNKPAALPQATTEPAGAPEPATPLDSTALYRALGSLPPAVDETELSRNPELRTAMADTRRAGIATAFFESKPGLLKIALAEGYRSVQAMGFTLSLLWRAYRNHRPFDEPGILELWDGDLKVGEYTQSGLALEPE
jgi:hypothetical protein